MAMMCGSDALLVDRGSKRSEVGVAIVKIATSKVSKSFEVDEEISEHEGNFAHLRVGS